MHNAARGFVRVSGIIARELQQWLAVEAERRKQKTGHHVGYGVMIAEGLVLLQDKQVWKAGEADRVLAERKLGAEREAAREERHHPCESCRIQPGIDFGVDQRWLCPDCAREAIETLAKEGAA